MRPRRCGTARRTTVTRWPGSPPAPLPGPALGTVEARQLLEKLAQIAIKENCFALAWMVLEWNEPAIKFYQSLGASMMSEWETMRIMEPHLSRLAEGASPKAPSQTGAITK